MGWVDGCALGSTMMLESDIRVTEFLFVCFFFVFVFCQTDNEICRVVALVEAFLQNDSLTWLSEAENILCDKTVAVLIHVIKIQCGSLNGFMVFLNVSIIYMTARSLIVVVHSHEFKFSKIIQA